MNILILEPSLTMSAMLETKISEITGVTTHQVKSITEAKSLVFEDKQKFDLLVTGTAVSEQKNEKSYSFINRLRIPTLLFTSNIDLKSREKITNTYWILDYIIKESPVSFDLLSNAIQRYQKNAMYTVLLVDDSESQLDYCEHLVGLFNFETLRAKDGAEALKLIEGTHVDVVITDYEMPHINGMELVKKIKQSPDNKNLIIICVSGSGDKYTLVEFLKHGANDFLEKPFLPEELYCRLNQNLDLLEKTRQFIELSYVDFLTKIPNRRYFFEETPPKLRESLENESSFTLAIMDVDHFKTINDNYGHDVGDAVLVELATKVSAQLDQKDIFARTGGEEFLLFFNVKEPDEAMKKLEKLRETIKAIELTINERKITLTASLGAVVSNSSNRSLSIDEFVEIADRALYLSKTNGRDKVTLL